MKFAISFIILFFLISCGGESTDSTNVENGNSSVNMNAGAEKFPDGEKIYFKNCVSCHQDDGSGIEGAFPPLANSDYLLADKKRAIHQTIYGSSGEMTVNGVVYNSQMPAQNLTDEEVRDVVNFILNQWGNDGGEVSLEEVQEQRKSDTAE